jgi:CYTH domain-containing protein
VVQEIERKFLPTEFDMLITLELPAMKKPDEVHEIEQYYLATVFGGELRIRNMDNVFYTATFKGERNEDAREESEVKINPGIYETLKKAAVSYLRKTRYVFYEGNNHAIYLDIFKEPSGLALIEIEDSRGLDVSAYPWVGKEVTNNNKYYGKNIAIPIKGEKF